MYVCACMRACMYVCVRVCMCVYMGESVCTKNQIPLRGHEASQARSRAPFGQAGQLAQYQAGHLLTKPGTWPKTEGDGTRSRCQGPRPPSAAYPRPEARICGTVRWATPDPRTQIPAPSAYAMG